jgi:hypothetical protein
MCPAGDDTLVREGDKLPADSLVLSTNNIWSIIRSQKDLNLPAHKVGRHWLLAEQVHSRSCCPRTGSSCKARVLQQHV